MKELNEDTTFKLSIKTLGGIAVLIFTLVSMWFMLQADIAEAKELPVIPPDEVTRMEFNMKDANIRLSIENTETMVEKMEERMIRLENKIDALR